MGESVKRRGPSTKPGVHKGMCYEQLRHPHEHAFKQGGGVFGAIDIASKGLLWTVQLYETRFDPQEERDAREVYISMPTPNDEAGVLLAVEERKQRWRLRLSGGKVTEIPASPK